MNDAKPLTKQQFLANHKAAYDKERLTHDQRLRRYADYARQHGTDRAPRRPRAPRRLGADDGARPRSASAPPTHASRVHKLLDSNELAAAMIDPFALGEGEVPRVPDGMMNHTQTARFKFNVPIASDANGNCAFIMRNSPFACYGASNVDSNVAPTDNTLYKGALEFNAAAAQTGRENDGLGYMPTWTTNSWSAPVIPTSQSGIQNAANTLQDVDNVEAFFAQAAAWRPVCGGYRFKYTAPVLSAEGEMAVARWPGTYGMPTQRNHSLRLAFEGESIGASDAEFGPSFETVQALPGAQVYTAVEGHTAVWAPNGLEAQTTWRGVKPFPIQGLDNQGISQVSNTPVTELYIMPPPINGDPARISALYDVLYGINLSPVSSLPAPPLATDAVTNVPSWTTAAGPVGYGLGMLFQGVPLDGGGTGISGDYGGNTSNAARDLMDSAYYTAMMEGDNALIMVGVGLPPSTVIGTIEIVVGVEYLPDTRVATFGGGNAARGVSLRRRPSQQRDAHAAALAIAKVAPASVAGTDRATGVPGVIDSVVRGVEAAAGAAPKLLGAFETMMPAFETLLAFL